MTPGRLLAEWAYSSFALKVNGLLQALATVPREIALVSTEEDDGWAPKLV